MIARFEALIGSDLTVYVEADVDEFDENGEVSHQFDPYSVKIDEEEGENIVEYLSDKALAEIEACYWEQQEAKD